MKGCRMYHRFYCTRCGNIQAQKKGVHCRHCGVACKDIVVDVDRSFIVKNRNFVMYFLCIFITVVLVAGFAIDYSDTFGFNMNFIDMLPRLILMLVVFNSGAVLFSFSVYYSELNSFIEMNVRRELRHMYGGCNYPFTFKAITKEYKKIKKLREKGDITREELEMRKNKLLKHWEDYLGYTNVKISLTDEGLITLVPVEGE